MQTLLAALVTACGGGGGSPTAPGPAPAPCTFPAPPPNTPDRTATFLPDRAAGANSISLQGGANCTDLLVLQIVATGVENLGGVRYTLDWPDDLLRSDNFRIGPFLSENGTVVVRVLSSDPRELRRPEGLPGVSGSGQIALVAWIYGPIGGSGAITLAGEALDADGNVVPGVDFIGGRVTTSP